MSAPRISTVRISAVRTSPRSAYRGAVVTCAFCGTVVESETPPITWVSAVENGRQRWFCDECSRKHLRAMESKLDSEWW